MQMGEAHLCLSTFQCVYVSICNLYVLFAWLRWTAIISGELFLARMVLVGCGSRARQVSDADLLITKKKTFDRSNSFFDWCDWFVWIQFTYI